MASHSNASQAHDFYYRGVNNGEEHYYSGCNLNYEGSTAISYRTAVAKVIPAKGVKDGDVRTNRPSSGFTLLSLYPMSSSTTRHIHHLRHASPFEVVLVPLERGDGDFTPDMLADHFAVSLTTLAERLNLRKNRDEFVGLLQSLRRIQSSACDKWARPLNRDRRLAKLESMDVSKAAEELKERNRRESARRRAETRKLFATYVKGRGGADYCEFIHVLFDPGYDSAEYPLDRDQRSLLRSKVARSDMAYVWLDGDEIRTSRHVRVPVAEAKVAMRLWALGKDMRAMPVGRYQIVSYKGDTIQIGCHKIPRENMLALYEAVMGEPFPEKKEAAA